MNHDEPIEPQVALGRFLNIVKNQADADQTFRDSLLQALGVTVIYAGEDEITNVAPHIVAAQKDELQFRAIYGQLNATKLKAILVTKSKLASKADAQGKTADDLIDMLWQRARNRAEEKGLVRER